MMQLLKADNLQVIDGIFDAFETLGLDVDLEKARNIKKSEKGNRTHLHYLGSAGIIDDAKSYIYSKAKQIQHKTEREEMYQDIESYFETYRLEYGSRNLMPKTPDLKQTVHLLTNGGYGFVGIAHPAKISLDGANQMGNFSLKKIIDDFIKFGGSAMEYNYQYTGTEGNEEYCDWIDSINKYYNDSPPKAIKAGGIDTHGMCIFKR